MGSYDGYAGERIEDLDHNQICTYLFVLVAVPPSPSSSLDRHPRRSQPPVALFSVNSHGRLAQVRTITEYEGMEECISLVG